MMSIIYETIDRVIGVCSRYGQHGLNWDQNNNVADRAAKRTAASSYGANKWGQSNNANHALNDELWSKGNQWYQVNAMGHSSC